MMDVPDDIEVPEGATRDYEHRVREVNAFLAEARRELARLGERVARVYNVRGNFSVHKGPGGIVLHA